MRIFGFIAFVLVACCSPDEGPATIPLFDTPSARGVKVAFFGDQGLGDKPRALLSLVKVEGCDAVLHAGDLDYTNDPLAWETQVNDVLGPDFPYFALVGNHDVRKWRAGGGYKDRLESRLERLGIPWEGELGIKSALYFKNLFFVLTAPGTLGEGHAEFIRSQLQNTKATWRICSWHKCQKLMQVGIKPDETGWEVYEEARLGGAIIATGHEHSYARTFCMASFIAQVVADRSESFSIGKGKTFAFHAGLGGKSIRPQRRLADTWWAKIYTRNQHAAPGALFGVFGVDGAPDRAIFYFKDIKGQVIDRFEVRSLLP